jgi:RNA polymerase sigma factor (sigma-70 family)
LAIRQLLEGVDTVMARSVAPEILSAAADDVDDFYSAVEPHIAKMGRVAARLAGVHNRDDVVQDALVQAWRNRRQFDPARGRFAAWLLAITAHQATKVRRRLASRLFEPRLPTPLSVEERLDLTAALHRLTARERLALDCYYFVGLSIAETAAVMGCAEGTVKSTLASGRERLRRVLGEG